MLCFQPPIPTPTPSPSLSEIERIVNRISDTINNSQQQGAVGAIQIVGIALIIFALYLLLKTYIGRNKKDTNGVLENILIRQQQQFENADMERKANQARIEQQSAEGESRYIKFGTGLREAMKYWADQSKEQGAINLRVSETLEAISIRESNQDELIQKIYRDGTEPTREIGANVKKILSQLAQLNESIKAIKEDMPNIVENVAREVHPIIDAVNDTFEQLNKKRGDTQPLPSIPRDTLDVSNDGKSTP